jgi:hypothetical protein
MRRTLAFIAAVFAATLWGSVAQTQSNLADLIALGADIPPALRMQTTLLDVLGFGPLYAAVVAATFLVAFALAARLPGARAMWFALAGFVGLIAAIRLIDAMVPPPVLIAATRGTPGLITMTLGGALGGFVYARLTRSLAQGRE